MVRNAFGRTEDEAHMSADRPDLRAHYIAQGLPACRGSIGCHRQPWRRGLCRVHMAEFPSQRSPLGVSAIVALKVPLELWNPVLELAALEGISGAEWVRRALAKALGRRIPASSGS